MSTPADSMDLALASWEFFGPFCLLVGVAAFVGLCVRWLKVLGRVL